MAPGRAIASGAGLSLALHLCLALLLASLPPAAELARTMTREAYEVEVEPVGGAAGIATATRAGHAPHEADPARAGGVHSLQNVDARDRGEGGDSTGATQAILLLHRADEVLLFDSPLNNVAAAQSQRIRTARRRATREPRRATPNPHDQPFLASGSGAHQERRPLAARDPAAGARVAPVASIEGALPSPHRDGVTGQGASDGAPALGGESRSLASRSSATSSARGTATASPGVGILGGTGQQHRASADVAHGRPMVDEGPAATLAEVRDPRVADDTDAELLAAALTASFTESSRRTGARAGSGAGGVGGGGGAGSGGGRAEGGRASAYGPGDGAFAALDTSDGRYRTWFLANRRRIDDALRFPRERALAMDQGTSIYSVLVRRDGTLARGPELVRTSGYDDLDDAARAAIRAATPFSPLPDDLAPGLATIAVRLPIEFSNPMVH